MAVTPEVRLAVLEAHKCRCFYCGECGADHIDHIVPCADGGADDLINLTVACMRCNTSKGKRGLPLELLRSIQRHAADMEPEILRMLEEGFSQVHVTQVREAKPKKEKPHINRVHVLLTDEQLSAVDAWVTENRVSNRNEGIRMLLKRGMR